MDLPPALLMAFPPSADLLLDIASRQVDDDMLAEIAAADHGMDKDAHLAGLRIIRDQGIVPTPLLWRPGEVLELIRWSNPENPAHKPGSTGRRGHQMRAFACAALLRSGAGNGGDSEATLALCLASAMVLSEEMSKAAARFLTWRIPRLVEGEQRWLFALGLLVVAARLRSGRLTDRALGDLAECVFAEEARSRNGIKVNPSDPAPLAFGLLYGHWRPLAVELLREAASIQADDVHDKLQFIGAFILESV